MSGKILIIDTVATNRIVLKVKMHAARYMVDTCSNRQDAEASIADARPDLILINLSDQSEDRHAFCTTLKNSPDTADIAIIALGVADTCRARFAALDAGADEVIPHPTDDTLLLARIRSLLRMRHTYAELSLRDGTSRALGFEETGRSFLHAARISVLMPRLTLKSQLREKLHTAFPDGTKLLSPEQAFKAPDQLLTSDLFIIDGTEIADNGQALFRLIADLRARSAARLAMQLVVLPKDRTDIAAMALDLGADDIVFDHTAPREWALRARVLINRKMAQDKLRKTVQSGLKAAVTDPLTGLYNRRYVTSHLQRLETQAKNSGNGFAVMMLDIDHFKAVNDTYGHAAGDAVLIELADRLRGNLRSFDLIARVGGEEFLIAMPDADTAKAQAAADRLCTLVNGTPFEIGQDLPALRITLSIGVAVGGIDDTVRSSGPDLCNQADKALYAAKTAGRDRVSLALSAA